MKIAVVDILGTTWNIKPDAVLKILDANTATESRVFVMLKPPQKANGAMGFIATIENAGKLILARDDYLNAPY